MVCTTAEKPSRSSWSHDHEHHRHSRSAQRRRARLRLRAQAAADRRREVRRRRRRDLRDPRSRDRQRHHDRRAGRRRRRRPRGRRRARRVRARLGRAQDDAGRPRARHDAPGHAGRVQCRRARRARIARQRQAAEVRALRRRRLDDLAPALLRGLVHQDRRRHAAGLDPGDVRLHAPRAGGRRGADHPVELPAADGRVEDRPGAGGRLHDRAQAARADAADGAEARRAGSGSRDPGGRAQRLDRRRLDRRGAGRSSRRGQDRLHRLDGCGTHDRRARRPGTEARDARARRQVAQRDPARRRPGGRDQGLLYRHLLQLRTGLQRRVATVRAEGPVRHRHERALGRREGDQGRARPGSRHVRRPARQCRAARARERLHRCRQGRGRAGQRRQHVLHRPHPPRRLLRRADALQRHERRRQDRPRGDLRPGPRRPALRGHRGGRAPRERHRVRPRRRRLDTRRLQRAQARRAAARRVGVREHLECLGPGRALRRLQVLWHRARARARRAGRVPGDQVGLRGVVALKFRRAATDERRIAALARTALPRPVAVTMVAVLGLLVADVAGALQGELFQDWFLWAVFGVGAVLCAIRAHQVPAERLAWSLFAAGWCFYVAGGIVFQVVLHESSAGFPSSADVLWLGLYVCDLAAVAALMHARGIGSRAAWLDGAGGSLAVAAAAAAFAFQPALDAAGSSNLVAVAYPLLDCLLVGFVVVVASAEGWRLDRTFGLLALGFVGLAGGDAQYLVSAANGTWTPDQSQNIPYVLATLCICMAAWQPGLRRQVVEFETRMFTIPTAFGLVAVALQAYEFVVPVNGLARSLDVLAILAVVVRLGFTFRDYARVLEASRHEALVDAITGLGNRRRLMRDLDDVVALGEPTAVVIFDLDGFKGYNDSFGHAAGDVLLHRLSSGLDEAALAAGGRAYRMGGDEFCVLLPDGADIETIAAALREDGSGFAVDCSYGSARVPCEAAAAPSALRLADRRMYAVKNARPISASSQTRDLLVRVLAERDPDLHNHVLDVGALADEVAAELGIAEQERPEIVHGAELHDVGKIAIPESILHKPGPLTDDEWTYMKRHTLIGERFLLSVPALRAVGRLVRSSHERWDRAGYPAGLRGEDIPLGARVISVCDAYDAMVTDRPYRKGTDTESALTELRRCAGTQFDPRVVEAFCAV